MKASTNVGRNDPCPCGSGIKYKKCCYKNATSREQNNFALFATQIDTAKKYIKANRLVEAEQICTGVLALSPEYAEGYFILAGIKACKGDYRSALEIQEMAVQSDIKNSFYKFFLAQIIYTLFKRKEVDIQGLSSALSHLTKAVELNNQVADYHELLGIIYYFLKEYHSSIASFEKLVSLNPKSQKGEYFLNVLKGNKVKACPDIYVEELFDNYSGKFDEHLTKKLKYNIPNLIAKIIKSFYSKDSVEILDLGCGTGLCASAIRLAIGGCQITGVDISKNMLSIAESKGIYDELSKGNIVDYLKSKQKSYDFIIASDVLAYIGEVDELFQLVKARLEREGKFIFSIEDGDDTGDYIARKSLRFAHSRKYIEKLLAKHKLVIERCSKENIRAEEGRYIEGYVYIITNLLGDKK